ncbi:hypothetical protein NUU61_004438 [Penicillium alfredii]|uniref:Uncharacterized protein n=1 Tax=Penicillium alfredii TaxID=1506179 RepID=A0A9W9FL39_9EURO|nr:uncharacterized protein NUU61_004438 [Penicillium alfredii]KAJ5102216.1 hypothetical protein NUU61_004438 [Penicillium alfredii]
MDPGIPSEPPSCSLKGKTAIVTGAGCLGDGIGNGRAISILLADDGCDVLCVNLNIEWAKKTVEMIASKPGRGEALPFCADVASMECCKAVLHYAMEQFGGLDILVNNVGVAGASGTAVDVDMAEWAKRCWAEGGTPHLLYPTAKGAVVNLTHAMAAHHASEGIRVNCVCPGMLYTPMMYGNGMSEEAREARRKRSLLGTEGNGWDCAGAVVFLAGPHARWMTGVILPVDAGTTAAVGIGMSKSASVNG